MDSLGLNKGTHMPDVMREGMYHEGIRQGVTRSLVFASAVALVALTRLVVAMARANMVFVEAFKYDAYTLMWIFFIVALGACAGVLYGLRTRNAESSFAMVFSLFVQGLCLFAGVSMSMAAGGGVNVLPYTTAMILFCLISTYPLGVTIPMLAGAHGLFILASLTLPAEPVGGSVLIDQTSVLALAVACLVIVYMARRNAYINEQLTRELTSRNDELLSLNRRMKALMLVDEMTGVSNRRGFDRDIELSWQHCKRQDLSLVVCLMDLDQFRYINEKFGRGGGNECLMAIAQRLTQSLKRSVDVVARLGGEEFALLLPFTDMEGGLIVAERVRAVVESYSTKRPVITEAGENGPEEEVRVTVSVGVAVGYPAHDRVPVSELMRRAEHSLRVAKQMGGNRVIPCADPTEAEAALPLS